MLARTPKQFDLGQPQRPSCSALGDFPQGALWKEESSLVNGN
jgi:hypothetical protein